MKVSVPLAPSSAHCRSSRVAVSRPLSETAYSSTSSYASYSGVRPDEREYSYRTWQTKTPNGSTRRSPFQYEQHEQWEDYVEDDFDEEISEEGQMTSTQGE